MRYLPEFSVVSLLFACSNLEKAMDYVYRMRCGNRGLSVKWQFSTTSAMNPGIILHFELRTFFCNILYSTNVIMLSYPRIANLWIIFVFVYDKFGLWKILFCSSWLCMLCVLSQRASSCYSCLVDLAAISSSRSRFFFLLYIFLFPSLFIYLFAV